MYQQVKNKLLYAEKFNYKNPATERFGEFLLFNENHVYVPMPELSITDDNFIGTLIDFKRTRDIMPWAVLQSDQVDSTIPKRVSYNI